MGLMAAARFQLTDINDASLKFRAQINSDKGVIPSG